MENTVEYLPFFYSHPIMEWHEGSPRLAALSQIISICLKYLPYLPIHPKCTSLPSCPWRPQVLWPSFDMRDHLAGWAIGYMQIWSSHGRGLKNWGEPAKAGKPIMQCNRLATMQWLWNETNGSGSNSIRIGSAQMFTQPHACPLLRAASKIAAITIEW